MPERATALTATAGEHYVAFCLSELGFPVALTRGGSPTIDLMVGDLSGRAALSIQVKTSSGARRERKRKTRNSHWEWDVGVRAQSLQGSNIFYAFVDLGVDRPTMPDTFIVPSETVARQMQGERSRYMYWIYDSQAPRFRERWELIVDRLNQRPGRRRG